MHFPTYIGKTKFSLTLRFIPVNRHKLLFGKKNKNLLKRQLMSQAHFHRNIEFVSHVDNYYIIYGELNEHEIEMAVNNYTFEMLTRIVYYTFRSRKYV